MADIELVIKIDKEIYNNMKSLPFTTFAEDIIINGTPLPKGHECLIDKDRLLDKLDKTVKSVDDINRHLLFWDRAVAHVHLSKPIIEADKAESEEI